MSLPTRAIFNALSSEFASLGLFSRTMTHEPKNSPGNGVYVSITLATIEPDPEGSGLNTTSTRINFLIRIISNMIAEPQDDIDPNLLDAVDLVYSRMNGNFDLDVSDVRNVDVESMSTRFGYVDIDGKKFRTADITLPVFVNDVWSQVE